MNYIFLLLLSAALTVGSLSSGQELKQAGAEDFIPSTLNQPGKQYPQVNSEGRVRASISAPQAMKVQLDIGGVKYDLKKDDKGVWTGDSDPQDGDFTTTSSSLTEHRYLIREACTSSEQAAGAAG